MKWTLSQSQDLCRKIEKLCPDYGCHVALTGGLLLKDGERKDCDLVFFRIRHIDKINLNLLIELEKLGIKNISGGNWRYVGYYDNKQVDLLFPEEDRLEYIKK
jgi:hypothetical protein